MSTDSYWVLFLKVILASGYSETDRVREALDLGARKYIKSLKPLKI
jgi:YesN/AraC family two-component response regulator